MKILFDTNVLISAFMTGGTCYDIIDDSIEDHEPYYTDFVLDEVRKIFKNNFKYPDSVIEKLTSFIIRRFIKGDTSDTLEKISRDESDDQLLADASFNHIDVIITGDKDLLELKRYKDIKIIPPKDYGII